MLLQTAPENGLHNQPGFVGRAAIYVGFTLPIFCCGHIHCLHLCIFQLLSQVCWYGLRNLFTLFLGLLCKIHVTSHAILCESEIRFSLFLYFVMIRHPLCGNPGVLIVLLPRDVIMLSDCYDVLIKIEHLIFLSGVLQTKDTIKHKECEDEETENKLLISNEIKGKLAVFSLFQTKICGSEEV